jgi:hypothetical protein
VAAMFIDGLELNEQSYIIDDLLSLDSFGKTVSEKIFFLVGSIYGRFCIKFPQSRMKGDLVIKKYIKKKKMYKIKNIVRCQYHTSIVLTVENFVCRLL